jgi:hypothetical protein
MTQETQELTYRGVRCQSCTQPIPLPAILAGMDSALRNKHSAEAQEYPMSVFSLRCRACYREKPYRASEIMDFEGTPRSSVSRSRLGHSFGRHTNGRARAANG